MGHANRGYVNGYNFSRVLDLGVSKYQNVDNRCCIRNKFVIFQKKVITKKFWNNFRINRWNGQVLDHVEHFNLCFFSYWGSFNSFLRCSSHEIQSPFIILSTNERTLNRQLAKKVERKTFKYPPISCSSIMIEMIDNHLIVL